MLLFSIKTVLLFLDICVSKVLKPTEPRPPGSFMARIYKIVVALIALIWGVNKIKVLQDILGVTKKMKNLPDRSGEVAVITGATRGIGLEVLKKLLQCDFKVIIGIRDLGAAEKAIRQIRDGGISTGAAVMLKLDLKSLNSVRNFAKQVLKETQRIDILINNAGVLSTPYEITENGYESQFQINYLGHFLLTNLLLQRIKDTGATKETSCRIVNVSSDANYGGSLDFTDLENCQVYSAMKAYFDSKFAQVLHAKYLDKKMRMDGSNVRGYSLHPGSIPSDLWTNVVPFADFVRAFLKIWFKTQEDGANVILFTATSPELENDGGAYINNFQKVLPNSRADDLNLQKLLWERSLQLSEKIRVM